MCTCRSSGSAAFARALDKRAQFNVATRHSYFALPVYAAEFSRAIFGDRKTLSLSYLGCANSAAPRVRSCLAHFVTVRCRSSEDGWNEICGQALFPRIRGQPLQNT